MGPGSGREMGQINKRISQAPIRAQRDRQVPQRPGAVDGFPPASKSIQHQTSRDRGVPSSLYYSAGNPAEGMLTRSRKDTPAGLLESMIMRMGGGPTSTFKGMYVDLVI
jgi:hypothetical protein